MCTPKSKYEKKCETYHVCKITLVIITLPCANIGLVDILTITNDWPIISCSDERLSQASLNVCMYEQFR